MTQHSAKVTATTGVSSRMPELDALDGRIKIGLKRIKTVTTSNNKDRPTRTGDDVTAGPPRP